MQRFLLFIILILNIVFITNLKGQVFPSLVRIDPPSYVQANQSFITSLVFTIDVVTTENVIIKFRKPSSIGISSAILKSWLGAENIPISPNGDNKNEIVFKLDSEKFALDANTMYQVLLECYTPKPISLSKDQFVWENDREKETIFNFDFNKNNRIEELIVYETQKTAGKSLEFIENSSLDFYIKNFDLDDLYIEFWMESDGEFENFVSLKNNISNDTLLTISKNNFGFVTFPIKASEIER